MTTTEIPTTTRKGEVVLTREQRVENFRRLESLVEARNISFYQLANDTAIPQSVFSDWKTGRSMPKANKLNKIAEYFGVDANYFT